jgi:hypothetical protein
VGTVTGSGTTYKVAVSGMTGGGTVIASIAAGQATDAAGNPNTPSTSRDDTVNYQPPASVSGNVFDDANGNGRRDGHEAGLSGCAVFIDLNHDGRHERGEPITLTNRSGNFTFGGLSPGRYSLMEIVPRGIRESDPSGKRYYSITLAAGQHRTGYDFGDAPIVRPKASALPAIAPAAAVALTLQQGDVLTAADITSVLDRKTQVSLFAS